MAARPNGAILYRGRSRIDGSPIVVIVTGLARASANVKTGSMLQTWILRSDLSPRRAVLRGADRSICGGCKHRGRSGRKRSCYVRIDNAPRSVYAAYRRGQYEVLDARARRTIAAGRSVRLGSYGDPFAVPARIWRDLLASAGRHTGYTHQWTDPRAASLRSLVLASVDTPAEYAQAHAAGWRTFRVQLPGEMLHPREITCPASAEAGHRTSCARCGLCDGARVDDPRASIAILAHGSPGVESFVALAALRRAAA